MKALMAVKFCILRRLNHAASTVVGAPEKRTYAPAFYVFLLLFSFSRPLARIFFARQRFTYFLQGHINQ